MKKIFTLMLVIATSLSVCSQTVKDSTSQLKMSLSRIHGDTTLITVANLQKCTASVRVTGTNLDTTLARLKAEDSASFVAVVVGSNKVTAMPDKNCSGALTLTSVTLWFELKSLPIKFANMTAAWTSTYQLLTITFTGTEVDTRVFRIQHSVNSRDWVTIEQNYCPVAVNGKYVLTAPMKKGNIEGVNYILLNKPLGMVNTIPLRKPKAGAIDDRFQKIYVRVISIGQNGAYTYSPILTVRTE